MTRTRFTKYVDSPCEDLRGDARAWETRRMRQLRHSLEESQRKVTERCGSCCVDRGQLKVMAGLLRSITVNGYDSSRGDIVATETREGGLRILDGSRRATILAFMDRAVPYFLRTFEDL